MKYFIFSVLVISILGNLQAQNDWALEKDKNGIKVWTRKRPNSSLKEYKGVTIINATVDELVEIFKNTKLHDQFLYKAQPGSVKVVKKNSDDDFYTYMIVNAPIVKDRDVVTHYKLTKDSKTGIATFELEAAPNLVPINSDYVRVPEMKGYWKFISKGNSTEVIHQAYSLTGGNIPSGLANSAAVDTPFSMLSKLKNLAEK